MASKVWQETNLHTIVLKESVLSFNPNPNPSSTPPFSSTKQDIIFLPFPTLKSQQTIHSLLAPLSRLTQKMVETVSDQSSKTCPAVAVPQPAATSITGRVRNLGFACIKKLNRKSGPLLVICVCLALVYKNRWRSASAPAQKRRQVLHRSVSMAALHGGSVALQRILDSQEARVDDAVLDDAERHLRDLLGEEPLSFKKIQKTAATLEMSGKEGEAAAMLRTMWDKLEKEGKPHEAHEIQMILVEMLIYKGDYEEALNCRCLYDKEISDARGPLYKAVIYTIQGNRPRAEECFKEFQNIRSRFHWPEFKDGSPINEVVHDFTRFEEIVMNLKKEIEQAHNITKANEKTKTLNLLAPLASSST